ncbi:hypothetical protein ACQR1H_28175 [Bradyrhizobium sp. HKCCYLRH2015]
MSDAKEKLERARKLIGQGIIDGLLTVGRGGVSIPVNEDYAQGNGG